MSSESSPAASKLQVFISYSRDDLEFADQLEAALKLYGFSTTLDRHGISGGEDWRRRLGTLIREADTIIFVLSPSSTCSEICAWEVSEAANLGKRIIPVLCRPLEAGTSPPSELASLDYIYFYPEPKSPGTGFGTGQVRLVTALNTDLDWLRQHTRLLLRASEWEAGGRQANRMLSGSDIPAAKAWIAARPKDAPEPTQLHLDYIRASEQWEAEQQNEQRRRLEERERLLHEAEADRKSREEALATAERALNQTARLWRRQAWAGAIAAVVLGLIGWWGYGVIVERMAVSREAARENIRGQIVAYATSKGETALDQAVGHLTSPYTTPLVDMLQAKDKSVSEVLVGVNQQVTDLALKTYSGVHVRPFFSTNMNGHVYLWQQPASRRKHAILIAAPDVGVGSGILQGPPHDAAAMKKVLLEAGFKPSEITYLENPTATAVFHELDHVSGLMSGQTTERQQWQTAILPVALKPGPALASEPPANTLLLIFFSGHGVTIDNDSYILTNIKGASLNHVEEVVEKAINVRTLVQTADEAAAASIVILDTHFPVLAPP
jgi:hypothetical protein